MKTNTITNNTTLTAEQAYTTLETVAEKVRAALDDDKDVWVEISGCMFVESCCIESIEFDGALRIQFAGMAESHGFSPDNFLGVDGLEESDLGCITLRFEGLTVEIECED